MPSIYTVIFDFGYLLIYVLLKSEEKHINILPRKIIRTERKICTLSIKKSSDFVN